MSEEMKNFSIVVDDGSRRVPITNTQGEEVGAFTFRPTDIGIIQRYNEMIKGFDGIVEPLEGIDQGDDVADDAHVEALAEAERRLYAAVDKLLNAEGAARAFFGRMSPFSPVGGMFYCEQVLQALGAFIGAQFETETAKFSERVKKYTNRAQRRAKK